MTAGGEKSFSSGPPGLSVSKPPTSSPGGSVAAATATMLLLFNDLKRRRAAVAAVAVEKGFRVLVRTSLRRPGAFNPPLSRRLRIFCRPPPPVASIAARLSSSSCSEGPVSLLSSSSSPSYTFFLCRLPVRMRDRSVGRRVRMVTETPPTLTASAVVIPSIREITMRNERRKQCVCKDYLFPP